jgi:hypothetical protein
MLVKFPALLGILSQFYLLLPTETHLFSGFSDTFLDMYVIHSGNFVNISN